MTEDKINDLATEIAKTYVDGKTMLSAKEFIELFLDVREAAISIITEKEMKKAETNEYSSGVKSLL